MKSIQIEGHTVNVFVEKTIAYYEKLTLCDCSGCRNFHSQIKGRYSEAEAFLAEFGVDIAKPDELFWWEADEKIECHPVYTVTGSVDFDKAFEVDVGCLKIVISPSDVPHEQTEPYFNITVYPIFLPWILDEPFPGSVNTSAI